MLTAAIELEQEDVNPDDYLEPKQQQQPHPAAKLPQKHSASPTAIEAEAESGVHHQRNSDSPRKSSSALLPSQLPLGIARNNNDSKSSSNNGWGATSLQQQRNSIIKLERRYRKDKENSWEEENSGCYDTEPRQEGARKRSFLANIEQDICKRSSGRTHRKKLCLSLTNPAGKTNTRSKKPPRKPEDDSVEKPISTSPSIFEEEEEVQLEAVTQAVESDDSSSRRSSQTIDWDKVEVCAEEDNEDHRATSPSHLTAPFNYDSLVASKLAHPHYAPKVYSSSLVSRLSLSKKQSQIDVSEAHSAVSVLNPTSRLSLSIKQFQTDVVAEHLSAPPPPREKRKQEESQQQGLGAKRAKQVVNGGVGEDDMSIHHHQQQHNHHYHLPSCNSSSNASSASFPESTSSILLLARAAAAGTADSPPSSKMSGHSHYTRSKPSHMQSRYSLASATDLAIAASLNEIPRSKVSSLQGRVDTGTATELAIAQSLSEDHQQNILNNSANSNAGTSSSVVNLSSPATTPASIAAAANMNNTLATLCNIGNSCYLNSVLYTLRFAPNFIHNLHHLIEDMDSVLQRLSQNKLKSSSLGRNIPGLHGSSGRSWSSKDLASLGGGSTGNSSSSSTLTGTSSSVTSSSGVTTNGSTGGGCISENLPPKSNRQVVTEQLHELFQNLHRNEAIETPEPFHAGNILRAVQDVSATFEGNQQQDAHEFLMCLLDSIRESCQALNKIITDHPDLLINTCPPVPECIETFVPETKSSSARVFFRRRKESVKTAKQSITANGGGATLPKGSSATAGGNGGDGSSTAEQLANLKNALFAKPCSALDEQLIRERVQALGLDFFRDDFEGVTVAKTKCLACETCTEQKETMIDIAIPITASEVSDAAKNPQLFYQNSCITQEYFRGDNKYRCEVCCGYREAIRSISFEVLPRQLILQLKRFNGDMEKINSYIPTPFVLRCFCNTCLPKPDCDKPHIYRLYSVITHVGARMSVGHYIAYTSSLDVHAEYLGCGKDRRRQLLLSGGSIDGGMGGGGGAGGSFGAGTTGSTGKSSEKSTSGQLKKLFSSKKASSAGDMSKKIKNNNKLNLINGIEGLNLINGSGGAGSNNAASFGSQSGSNSPSSNGTPTGVGGTLASRIPCAGLNCCGIHLKNSHLSLYGNSSSSTNSSGSLVATSGELAPHHTNGTAADGSGDGPAVSANPSSTSSSPAGSGTPHSGGSNSSTTAIIGNGLSAATTPAAFEQSLSQQLWHMCDDDKIKIMSQTEFEELLSPNRRHVITPYLLFYARYDLVRQKDATAAATTADGKPGDSAAGLLPDGSATVD